MVLPERSTLPFVPMPKKIGIPNIITPIVAEAGKGLAPA